MCSGPCVSTAPLQCRQDFWTPASVPVGRFGLQMIAHCSGKCENWLKKKKKQARKKKLKGGGKFLVDSGWFLVVDSAESGTWHSSLNPCAAGREVLMQTGACYNSKGSTEPTTFSTPSPVA